ncbi:TIGR02450 family Trp-rich protein [Shewanella fidelis]|uniref:TIGR02450 family Trp-rich protein n=1 Tax=Shewanella fidelis TaxID=173509 RepID=A0AAW8NRJ1_9GAMM|nr:TIGR02450 family Trp-rich protein [Shewanella fidelis]MDR8525186.1 TIGR02450 family Trp-rich protein [Shewanella fidelis]MDW4811257.1 TIGR02450 family Trp-rich protein [Shewanella fidelis]MDW4814964.1 TIGR02450 family Trp-rich protein [Shewanella fidelis]MDW4819054.1 TIGR02450 family Trp-rich protein [Shewanella fidelis]MDW4823269.1 TIGR02450 family Trp-rich protein [Shewanella fidelis]
MNKINPKKLFNSKWTAVEPKDKQKHFIVTKVKFDENGEVSLCLIEAALTRKESIIDWRELTQPQIWRQGWM